MLETVVGIETGRAENPPSKDRLCIMICARRAVAGQFRTMKNNLQSGRSPVIPLGIELTNDLSDFRRFDASQISSTRASKRLSPAHAGEDIMKAEPRSSFYHLSAMCISVLISGCGNFYESLSVGNWTSVRTDQPPTVGQGQEISTKLITDSNGTVVRVNEVVKIRVVVHKEYLSSRKTYASPPYDVWLWTGSYQEDGLWGEFGSPAARKSLIGRTVGQKLAWETLSKSSLHVIPTYGITDSNLYDRADILGGSENFAVVSSDASERIWSEVEVLATCPAKLFLRTAQIEQWGQAPNWGDANHPNRREGTLRWSALEGMCMSPDGSVRFMIGPMYYVQKPGSLYNWKYTFFNKRPKKQYPEEYRYVLIAGEPLPCKRKANPRGFVCPPDP